MTGIKVYIDYDAKIHKKRIFLVKKNSGHKSLDFNVTAPTHSIGPIKKTDEAGYVMIYIFHT